MKNYLKLLRFVKEHRGIFMLAVFFMFLSGAFEAFSFSLFVPMVDIVFNQKKIIIPNQLPEFIRNLINSLNDIPPAELLPLLMGIFLVGNFLKNVLTFVYQYLMSDVSLLVIRDIRFKLYSKIQSLSLDYFSEKRTGELVSRITYDANFIENASSYALTDLFRQSFSLIFWISMAFMLDPLAALVIFAVFPLVAYPMSRIGATLKKLARNTQEKMADINTLLLETISGVKLVKAFGTEAYETERFKSQNQDVYKLRFKAVKRLSAISPLTDVLAGFLGAGLVYWYSGRLLNHELSTGVFVLFMGSIMQIISPIKKLGNVNAITQQALAANERIYEVLDEEPTVKEKPQAPAIAELKNQIVLENVDFQYLGAPKTVLNNINLNIKKGELLAIVGPTGTGKTTLVNLLPRFYDPVKGSVKLDGVDVRDVSFLSLRRQFGIVTQETILFNDTVRANIAYGSPNMDLNKIQEAAKKAFAHQFIEKLPLKYDTIIGDRGFRLSGGEKQRLSIARAILKNPPILILDEATSALDSESEKYIQEALDLLMQGRTVVAIAHRLSTIKKADKIVVLDQGQMVGLGTHEQLMKDCALYAKLYAMQFSGA